MGYYDLDAGLDALLPEMLAKTAEAEGRKYATVEDWQDLFREQSGAFREPMFMDSTGIVKAAPSPATQGQHDDPAGYWMTLHHHGQTTHVFVNHHGAVTKGPGHLQGVNIRHLPPAPHVTITRHSHRPKGHNAHPSYTEHHHGPLPRSSVTRAHTGLAHAAAQSHAAKHVHALRLHAGAHAAKMRAVRAGVGRDFEASMSHVTAHPISGAAQSKRLHEVHAKIDQAVAGGHMSAEQGENARHMTHIHGPDYVAGQMAGLVAADQRHHIVSQQGHIRSRGLSNVHGHAVSGGTGGAQVEDPARTVHATVRENQPDETKLRPDS